MFSVWKNNAVGFYDKIFLVGRQPDKYLLTSENQNKAYYYLYTLVSKTDIKKSIMDILI